MIPWLPSPEDDPGDDAPFPPPRQALGDESPAPGLLAAGGRLSVKRLRRAYAQGIFPWFSIGEPVLWWSTAPRMVLQVQDFKLHRSLKKTLRHFIADPRCEIRIDSAFAEVLEHCAHTPREGQAGTWIVPAMQRAYRSWHLAGDVHSIETWVDGRLVGGLYGVSLGRMFYGESMFALATDASKIALAALVAFCRVHGIDWIDCQQQTGHLARLGAAPVSREAFQAHLAKTVAAEPVRDWSYDASTWRALDPALMPASTPETTAATTPDPAAP
jgi:leucyl/phenylalanyl-tRNA--protein transferase